MPRSPSSLCLIARSARYDVRRKPPSSSDPTKRSCRRISTVLEAFRRLLLQTGGANIASADRALWPPTSSSLGDQKHVASLLLSTATRDPCSMPRSPSSLCLIARSARYDVRRKPPSSSDPTKRSCRRISTVLEAFRRLLLQTGGANIASADRALWPPTSSSLGDQKHVASLTLSTATCDPCSMPRSPSSLCLIARSARCDVRRKPPSSSDPTKRSCRRISTVLEAFRRLLLNTATRDPVPTGRSVSRADRPDSAGAPDLHPGRD